MNRNKIRHNVLKVLVENYEALVKDYGEDGKFLAPMYYYKLKVPVNKILEIIKVSHSDFEQASTKAIREKAYKFTNTKDHEESCTLAENTFLFYHEGTYLKESKWYQGYVWKITWPLIVAGLISFLTTLILQKVDKNEFKAEQKIIDKRQDSLINHLTDSILIIKKNRK